MSMKRLQMRRKRLFRRFAGAFTYVEVLVVAGLLSIIMLATYKVFFSQAKLVTQSLEFMQVNDNFRKITTFLGKDIREANQILFPHPIVQEDISKLTTSLGMVLHLRTQEINPALPFDGPLGQMVRIRDIYYELQDYPNPLAKTIPRYKLVRTEYIEEKPGERLKHVVELADNIRDFNLFRTIRKPMTAQNLTKLEDRFLTPYPSHKNGTGNNLLHMKVTIERTREHEKGEVYQIAMTTSFYKRGKEIFKNK